MFYFNILEIKKHKFRVHESSLENRKAPDNYKYIHVLVILTIIKS
jgi:hypothetical protein